MTVIQGQRNPHDSEKKAKSYTVKGASVMSSVDCVVYLYMWYPMKISIHNRVLIEVRHIPETQPEAASCLR